MYRTGSYIVTPKHVELVGSLKHRKTQKIEDLRALKYKKMSEEFSILKAGCYSSEQQ